MKRSFERRAVLAAFLLAPGGAWSQPLAPDAAARLRILGSEPIIRPNAGIAGTYLGRPELPQPDRLAFRGHLQISGNLGAWGSQTNALTVVPNLPAEQGVANMGNMGAFWDLGYRTAYAGQDQGAAYFWMRARPPLARDLRVLRYGTATVATPAGNQSVQTVTLATPLAPAELAAMGALPPTLRVESGNGMWAYTVPPGLKTPAGDDLPPVSPDGRTIVVDSWARIDPPRVEATAGLNPQAAGGSGDALAVTVDVTRQIDVSYGGWRISDEDMVTVAMGDERVFINAKGAIPALNLADPLSSPLLTVGAFYGVVAETGQPSQGTAGWVATDGWQAGFVARNRPIAAGGASTYGFLVPHAGPTWGLYSTQSGGYVLGADPGNSCGPPGQQAVPGASCRRTFLLDTQGNSSQAGNLGAGGQIAATGPMVPGNFAAHALPPCGATTLGAHIYVHDARKPGEAPGAGSGVPADCTPLSRNGALVWVSVYDHAPVRP